MKICRLYDISFRLHKAEHLWAHTALKDDELQSLDEKKETLARLTELRDDINMVLDELKQEIEQQTNRSAGDDEWLQF